MMNRFVAWGAGAFVTALAVMAAGCSKPADDAAKPAVRAASVDDRAGWPKVLNVSAIPDVNQNTLLTTYAPFTEYLSKRLGVEVKFTPVTDYPGTVDGIAAGRLDLVWFGGYTSVQAVKAAKGNVERLVCRVEDLKFKSVFVANPASGIKRLADLKGKTFSFGSLSSTSGHLMPRSFLRAAGIDAETDLGNVSYSKGHDATVIAVETGAVEAGALNYLVWDKMTAEKKYDATKVAVFFITPEYVDYCWCARKDLPASLRVAIKKAFLDLKASDAENKQLMDLQKATGYVECKDEWWNGIEEAAKAAGMLKD